MDSKAFGDDPPSVWSGISTYLFEGYEEFPARRSLLQLGTRIWADVSKSDEFRIENEELFVLKTRDFVL